MPTYRRKPAKIQAEQWFSGNCLGVRYLHHNYHDAMDVCPVCDHLRMDHGLIQTIEGPRMVCPGDWIITSADGELSACRPDTFKREYEKVNK